MSSVTPPESFERCKSDSDTSHRRHSHPDTHYHLVPYPDSFQQANSDQDSSQQPASQQDSPQEPTSRQDSSQNPKSQSESLQRRISQPDSPQQPNPQPESLQRRTSQADGSQPPNSKVDHPQQPNSHPESSQRRISQADSPPQPTSKPESSQRRISQADSPPQPAFKPESFQRRISQADSPPQSTSKPKSPQRRISQADSPPQPTSKPKSPQRRISQAGSLQQSTSKPKSCQQPKSQPDSLQQQNSQADSFKKSYPQPDSQQRMFQQNKSQQPNSQPDSFQQLNSPSKNLKKISVPPVSIQPPNSQATSIKLPNCQRRKTQPKSPQRRKTKTDSPRRRKSGTDIPQQRKSQPESAQRHKTQLNSYKRQISQTNNLLQRTTSGFDTPQSKAVQRRKTPAENPQRRKTQTVKSIGRTVRQLSKKSFVTQESTQSIASAVKQPLLISSVNQASLQNYGQSAKPPSKDNTVTPESIQNIRQTVKQPLLISSVNQAFLQNYGQSDKPPSKDSTVTPESVQSIGQTVRQLIKSISAAEESAQLVNNCDLWKQLLEPLQIGQALRLAPSCATFKIAVWTRKWRLDSTQLAMLNIVTQNEQEMIRFIQLLCPWLPYVKQVVMLWPCTLPDTVLLSIYKYTMMRSELLLRIDLFRPPDCTIPSLLESSCIEGSPIGRITALTLYNNSNTNNTNSNNNSSAVMSPIGQLWQRLLTQAAATLQQLHCPQLFAFYASMGDAAPLMPRLCKLKADWDRERTVYFLLRHQAIRCLELCWKIWPTTDLAQADRMRDVSYFVLNFLPLTVDCIRTLRIEFDWPTWPRGHEIAHMGALRHNITQLKKSRTVVWQINHLERVEVHFENVPGKMNKSQFDYWVKSLTSGTGLRTVVISSRMPIIFPLALGTRNLHTLSISLPCFESFPPEIRSGTICSVKSGIVHVTRLFIKNLSDHVIGKNGKLTHNNYMLKWIDKSIREFEGMSILQLESRNWSDCLCRLQATLTSMITERRSTLRQLLLRVPLGERELLSSTIHALQTMVTPHLQNNDGFVLAQGIEHLRTLDLTLLQQNMHQLWCIPSASTNVNQSPLLTLYLY